MLGLLDQLGQEIILLADVHQDKGTIALIGIAGTLCPIGSGPEFYYIRLSLDKVAYSEKMVIIK